MYQISNCCNASPIGEVINNEGLCSNCKEWAEFLDDDLLTEQINWNVSFEEQIILVAKEFQNEES